MAQEYKLSINSFVKEIMTKVVIPFSAIKIDTLLEYSKTLKNDYARDINLQLENNGSRVLRKVTISEEVYRLNNGDSIPRKMLNEVIDTLSEEIRNQFTAVCVHEVGVESSRDAVLSAICTYTKLCMAHIASMELYKELAEQIENNIKSDKLTVDTIISYLAYRVFIEKQEEIEKAEQVETTEQESLFNNNVEYDKILNTDMYKAVKNFINNVETGDYKHIGEYVYIVDIMYNVLNNVDNGQTVVNILERVSSKLEVSSLNEKVKTPLDNYILNKIDSLTKNPYVLNDLNKKHKEEYTVHKNDINTLLAYKDNEENTGTSENIYDAILIEYLMHKNFGIGLDYLELFKVNKHKAYVEYIDSLI